MSAAVIGLDIHSGGTVKTSNGCGEKSVPDCGALSALTPSACSTSATVLVAPVTNVVIKGNATEVSSPVMSAVAGTML